LEAFSKNIQELKKCATEAEAEVEKVKQGLADGSWTQQDYQQVNPC
jgi:hypothetical protein